MCIGGDLGDLSQISGLSTGGVTAPIQVNPSIGNPDDLDALPFPKRTTFHRYFDKPIASILTSRGCWRECAFCSINAWYSAAAAGNSASAASTTSWRR